MVLRAEQGNTVILRYTVQDDQGAAIDLTDPYFKLYDQDKNEVLNYTLSGNPGVFNHPQTGTYEILLDTSSLSVATYTTEFGGTYLGNPYLQRDILQVKFVT